MERTKIDRATISKLETGKIPNPTYQTLRTYARALGKRIVWRLEDREPGGKATRPE
jgi:transcriptional regulator with XRE-family HTH domain